MSKLSFLHVDPSFNIAKKKEKIAKILIGAFVLPLLLSYFNQSHYREVLRWEIFMEQELRFGLDLDQQALLKKTHLGQL